MYETIFIQGNDTESDTYFNHTYRITSSGLVSTFFVFGRHHNQTIVQDNYLDEFLDDLDDFFADLLDMDTEVMNTTLNETKVSHLDPINNKTKYLNSTEQHYMAV